MVKGVNKNVIEINDTGSDIFERIVFYVSPKFSTINQKRILKESEKFTVNYRENNKNTLRARCIRRKRRFLCLLILSVLAIAATITAIIVY